VIVNAYHEMTQRVAVLDGIKRSLKPGGLIVLGKAEVLPASFSSRYEPVGDKTNIFRKRIAE